MSSRAVAIPVVNSVGLVIDGVSGLMTDDSWNFGASAFGEGVEQILKRTPLPAEMADQARSAASILYNHGKDVVE